MPKAMAALGDIPMWGKLTPAGPHHFIVKLYSQNQTLQYTEDCWLHEVHLPTHQEWVNPTAQSF